MAPRLSELTRELEETSRLAPRGLDYSRLVIARGLTGTSSTSQASFVEMRWPTSTLAFRVKAAVAAGSTTDASFGGPLAVPGLADEFLEAIRPRTILGKIAGWRTVPFNASVPAQTTGTSSYWVGEQKPKPLSAGAFNAISLPPRKVAGLVVLSEELLRLSDAEPVIRADLENSAIELSDTSFIDPTRAAVAGISPASITNAAPSTVATANLDVDLKALFNQFTGDLDRAYFVANPRTAASVGIKSGGKGAVGGDIGARGGVLAGIPLITAQAVPLGTLVLLDPGLILLADGGIDIDRSEAASVEMQDTPTDPVVAATVLISLWQSNRVGFKVERMINFAIGKSGAVVLLTGIA